jgi:molybdate transport system substrate-binding protein
VKHRALGLYAVLVLFLSVTVGAPVVRADTLTVGAASSLTNVLNDIGQAFTKANPQITVRFTFAASGTLMQQIRQGAPLDVFASASPKEMDALTTDGSILKETRIAFVGNHLALIAPLNSSLKRWEDLRLPSVKRVALSDPTSVPSGRYAKETLTKRGLWSIVQTKAVFGQNVRQTLAYVANGDVDAGIVFTTDAKIDKKVKVITEAVPGKDHSPILYPAAVVTRSKNADSARRFVRFLQSPTAQAIFRHYGFTPIGATTK